MTASADDPIFRTRVDEALSKFVADRRPVLIAVGPELEPFVDAATAFVDGGKRLRPQFCHAGWLVAGGEPADPGLVTAAAAFEWLQASALVHDDLIDASDTRRGRPSAHRAFEARHRESGAAGDAAAFGAAAAVLLGDLLLSWSDEMHATAPQVSPALVARPERAFAARRHWDLCKMEVVAGQFLDVVGQTHTSLTVADAMRVVRYKTAKYTVERPLHVGASLAGADQQLIDGLTAVALPLGEAFQLRDDVLGVFGDPSITGKPAGDDLREGKRTVLVARTAELTDEAGRLALHEGLGRADRVEEVRQLMESSGAREAVEADIVALEARALDAIEDLGQRASDILVPMLRRVTRRES